MHSNRRALLILRYWRISMCPLPSMRCPWSSPIGGEWSCIPKPAMITTKKMRRRRMTNTLTTAPWAIGGHSVPTSQLRGYPLRAMIKRLTKPILRMGLVAALQSQSVAPAVPNLRRPAVGPKAYRSATRNCSSPRTRSCIRSTNRASGRTRPRLRKSAVCSADSPWKLRSTETPSTVRSVKNCRAFWRRTTKTAHLRKMAVGWDRRRESPSPSWVPKLCTGTERHGRSLRMRPTRSHQVPWGVKSTLPRCPMNPLTFSTCI
mmetsp:Transcript_5653/g.15879  ORF Transcript_5653/g.15879 Transcript_5653/m.15879 type:complete len:261 (-) Transcript_5653:650-1432(-)